MRLLIAILLVGLAGCQTIAPPTPQPVAPAGPTCPKVVIENRTDEPFNSIDKWNLSIALKRCKQLYKNSPCLVKFIKKAPGAYGAVCGGYDG